MIVSDYVIEGEEYLIACKKGIRSWSIKGLYELSGRD